MNWVEGEVWWHLESPEFSPQHKTEQNLQVIKVLGIIPPHTHTIAHLSKQSTLYLENIKTLHQVGCGCAHL